MWALCLAYLGTAVLSFVSSRCPDLNLFMSSLRNALQLKRCPFNFQHDVKETMLNMSAEIDSLNDKLVVLVAKALRTSFKDDFSRLVGATSRAAAVLEIVAPRFITLTNKTSASLQDAGIDAFGGKAEEEQTSLLRMQRFLVDHAGEVLKNIAAARSNDGDTGCLVAVLAVRSWSFQDFRNS